MDTKMLRTISKWLVLIGALNWAFVGFFRFNVVALLLSGFPMLERLVYMLVGVAGVWGLLTKLGVVSGDKSGKSK